MCHLAEMLEGGHASSDRLADYYRALGRESRRLRNMVESLLDFSRFDAGQRAYQFEDTDAAELVDRVVRECRDQSPATADRIEWHVPSDGADRPVWIRADREALALALRNLVDNAVKYSPASSPVRVSVTSRGNVVGIAVEDEGAGISKIERRQIFQKFARGSAAQLLNVKGTGIGLTMAEQIVRAHGGRLELESELGRGTRFTTLLPVQS
jgi:signal transduction histidine kinase